MPIPSHISKQGQKDRKGDTGRTSSQGRKAASGGIIESNNQGRPKGNAVQQNETPVTSRRGK
jgi:hypothetical protein